MHGTTGEVPFTRLRAEDVQAADEALGYDTSVLTTRRSGKDCFISYAGTLSSVPAASARKTVQVKITEAQDLVMCSEVGQEVTRLSERLDQLAEEAAPREWDLRRVSGSRAGRSK